MKRCTSLSAALAAMVAALVLGGCATPPPPVDYSAFAQAKPASLLILPPLNESPEVTATAGVWAHATRPLAEAGYYVLSTALVDQTFRQNGWDTPDEIHAVPTAKLREVFGADAVLYLRIKKYGTSYAVLLSDTRVEIEGRLVDLRSGTQLWAGSAAASSAEQQQQAQGGLVGLLVVALVRQIADTALDAAFLQADVANQRLLGGGLYNGVLYGPRSPKAGQPPVPAR